ncbi:MAG: T9SS type A sorting domain-containing protein, partial [Bacteroidia bacterium]|nr:T9SS type A sorting domain-containing protein [Bacteroidia bacterium]
NLTITTENGNIVYYNLYDNDGSTILGGSYLYGGTKTSTINGLAAGTYYVRVYATNYNSYRLRNTLSLPPYANDIEQNNTFGTAYSWNNRPSRTGHISYRENGGTYNTDDYYKITMHSAGDCSFDIQMANGNLCYFYFYNSAQTQLFTTYIYGGTYSFNFTSLAAGDYYFRVYTAGGNYNSYSVTNFSIPCNPAPAVITAGGPTTFCIPGNVTLNTQDPGEYASFLWNNSETTANITVSTSGAFSVTATDWDGCSHPSNTINVSAVSPPVASITPNGSTTFCQGGSVDLDASAGASWLWSNGATTQSINVTASGTFTVTVTNAQGCSATSAGTTVTVNPLPTVTLNPFSAVCTSDPVFALTGGSPSGGTYSGTGVSGGNFDPAAAGVGTFLITYSYTDGNGCSAQASQLITVNNCIGCVASITPGGSTTFCDGGSVMLTASAGVSYLWSTGATTQSITATTSGTYTVTVTDAFNCSATASETVTVHVLPTATISGSGAICLGNSGTVTLNFTGNGPWYYTVNGSGGPYSGVSNSNSLNLSVTPVTSGTQSYSIVSLSDVNCNGNGSGAAVFNVSSQPPTNTAKEPSAPLSACSGDVALISCNVITGQNIEYSWNTGSNSSIVKFSNNINGPFTAAPFITTVNQVYAQFGSLAPGSSGYNICLKGENGCGTTNNRCVFVRGKVTVPAGINGSAIVCSGATNQLFSVSGSLPSGVQTFIWSFSVPGAIITSLDPPLNSQVTIDFPVFSSGTLSVQSGLTCLGSSVSAARTMKINNATAIPGVMTGPSKVCPGQSYNYSVSPVAGAVNYNWVIPANASIINGAGTNSVIVEFDSSPINFVNQIIRVSAISSCSISSQPREKKVASQVPAKPGAITGITTSACDGPFTYSVPAISGVDYNWTWPAGVSNNTPNGLSSITLQFPNNFVSGAISVTGSTSGCAIQSNVRSTNVNGKPARPSSITVNMAPCNGDPGQFEASSVAGATSYTWTVPNNGTSLDQGQGQQAIDVTWGTGPGTLTVKANNGCGSSALRSYYYSPNCIMRTYSEASYTESFVVNPNPASTMATITFKSDETRSYMISLMDLSGRRVSSATVSAVEGFNSIKLDLERYAKGLYVVELRSGNQIEKAKLVIE